MSPVRAMPEMPAKAPWWVALLVGVACARLGLTTQRRTPTLDGSTPAAASAVEPQKSFSSGALPSFEDIVVNGWVLLTTDYAGLGTKRPQSYLIGDRLSWAPDRIDGKPAADNCSGLP